VKNKECKRILGLLGGVDIHVFINKKGQTFKV